MFVFPAQQYIDAPVCGAGDQISKNALVVKVGDKWGYVEGNGVAAVLNLVVQSHGIGLGWICTPYPGLY